MGLTGGYFEFSAAHPQKEIPIIATIGISLPSFQLPKSRMKSAAKAVKDAASDISRQFGWKGDTDFKSMRKGAEQ